MRKYSCFLLVLSVVLIGLGYVHAETPRPFETVATQTDGSQLPLLIPAVQKTVSAPTEAQPKMRPGFKVDIDPSSMDYQHAPHDIDPRDFPSGPVRFDVQESFADLPISSPGRWLHSATVIGNKMYVFGGISSYSEKLMNDLWVFDYRMTAWSQLQRSYVPPLPPGEGRPKDIPLPPSYKEMPEEFAHAKPAVPVMELPYNTIHDGVGYAHPDANAQSDFSSFLQVDSHLRASQPEFATGGFEYPQYNQAFNPPHPAPMTQGVDPAIVYPNLFRGQSASPVRPSPRDKVDKHLRQHFQKAYASQTASQAAPEQPQQPDHIESFAWMRSQGDDGVNDWPAPPIDLWEYDLDTKLWKCLQASSKDGRYAAAVPETRWMHTGVTVQDTMIIFGGVTREKQIKGDLWVFQPEDNTWMEAHPAAGTARPLPRQGHCAAAVGNIMYIFGGVSYGYQPFNDVWAYNVVTNEWTELSPNHPYKGPAPRWLTSCTIVEDGDSMRFFVFGGVGKEQVPMNDLHVFDISSNAWTQPAVSEGFAPFPRMMHNMVWMGSRVFVFGGLANNIPFEDLHYYDLKTGRWSEVLPSGSFPFARGGASACKLQPTKTAVPDRPNYNNFDINNRPNARWSPRYRKTWNENNFMVIFGGVGVVQG